MAGNAPRRRAARLPSHVWIAALASLLGIALTAAGTWYAPSTAPPHSRVWASVFFIALLWPVGLALLGRAAGVRLQAVAALALLAATAGQRLRPNQLPLPEHVRWFAALDAPNDAIRHRIPLPPATDAAWDRAWRVAASAVVAVCTERAAPSDDTYFLSLNGGPETPLATLSRNAERQSTGWYALAVTRDAIERSGELDVVLRRAAQTTSRGSTTPLAVCGGRTDPRRSGRSAHFQRGQWSTTNIARWYVPPAATQPERYYVELRLYDARGAPTVGVWY